MRFVNFSESFHYNKIPIFIVTIYNLWKSLYMMEYSSEESIVKNAIREIKSGNDDAFRILIRSYQTPAYSIAYRILRNSDDAQEAVQDAFMRAYKKLNQFSGESKFSSWFLKIVYNVSLSRVRKKKLDTVEINENIDKAELFNDSSTKDWDSLESNERVQFVREAIEKLGGDDALVITLFYLSEHSMAEICEITGWKQSSAKVKLHRARQKLHASLFTILKFEMKELI